MPLPDALNTGVGKLDIYAFSRHQSLYCTVIEAFGSVRIRSKSLWSAPAVQRGLADDLAVPGSGRRFRNLERARSDKQNVVSFAIPCLVETVQPSTSGSRSR